MVTLPSVFLERLQGIIPPGYYDTCLKSFTRDRLLSVRVNTLKISRDRVLAVLDEQKIEYTPIGWCPDALILRGIDSRQLTESDLIKQGFLYIQSLSSMLPVIALNPQPGDRVLDMCAAPGGKTTQMAALMNNAGSILAVEKVKERFYKLKTIVAQSGAGNVTVRLMDAKRLHAQGSEPELYDKVLLDVPCTTEGRFKVFDPKTYAYWSPRKIKEMVQKQRGLILTASRLLKPDGVIVYSTCTFAPEENEAVMDWFLKKTKSEMAVEPVALDGIRTYPAILEWKGKRFNPKLRGCLRVLPDEMMEGFFVARLKRSS
ncbi:MAG TPA: RsmB/NOP family class I SAM-dependent RNA methyltransferase [Candidatus Omnitrophota bacterium]|nr:RsmB/NOP family class I SAM-dependent RNA methyltransferase [Candidatus Omnitrophota bacterium]HPD84370.1 RsmB/NOP family class I SAM-dependent RNA methyltransferase [Candidatus Omnitrophota bacterium]HRZ03228.1 RsmB/NOP family class I SAM-dependent RNA methyltransferase [Candidatus Omnitrophota bacterium]